MAKPSPIEYPFRNCEGVPFYSRIDIEMKKAFLRLDISDLRSQSEWYTHAALFWKTLIDILQQPEVQTEIGKGNYSFLYVSPRLDDLEIFFASRGAKRSKLVMQVKISQMHYQRLLEREEYSSNDRKVNNYRKQMIIAQELKRALTGKFAETMNFFCDQHQLSIVMTNSCERLPMIVLAGSGQDVDTESGEIPQLIDREPLYVCLRPSIPVDISHWLEDFGLSKDASAEELHHALIGFNWDDDIEFIYWIVTHPNCSEKTIIATFWLMEGFHEYRDGHPIAYMKQRVYLIKAIEDRLRGGVTQPLSTNVENVSIDQYAPLVEEMQSWNVRVPTFILQRSFRGMDFSNLESQRDQPIGIDCVIEKHRAEIEAVDSDSED